MSTKNPEITESVKEEVNFYVRGDHEHKDRADCYYTDKSPAVAKSDELREGGFKDIRIYKITKVTSTERIL